MQWADSGIVCLLLGLCCCLLQETNPSHFDKGTYDFW
jgi:hypothetical protein